MVEPNPLLPDLAAWNNGEGIDTIGWLYAVAQSDVAVAYAEMFWPQFVEFEGYVLRSGFSIDGVRSWERAEGSSRRLVETMSNLFFVEELFTLNNEDWTPLVGKRAVHIGCILVEVYEAKLARDFPEKHFKVSFEEGANDSAVEMSLSFWQVEPD